MAINPDIRDQAYQFFIEEAPELLQILETGLLTVSQERSPAKVHELMRAAHSLKGGAASVGLEAIKTIAHRLETIFKSLHSDTVDIDSDLENQLLQAYDCLSQPLNSQIRYGYFDSEQTLAVAEPIFARIEERLQDAIKDTESYIPSAGELGVDMALSIFEVDVKEGLDHLTNVVANPQAYELVGELRAQAEVFSGFAELLNKPGFGAIAETVLAAIKLHPENIVEIIKQAVKDFEAGRQAVLTKDDPQGGKPSATLLAWADSNHELFTSNPSVMETPPASSEFPIPDVFEPIADLENEIFETIADTDDALFSWEKLEAGVPSLEEIFSPLHKSQLQDTSTTVSSQSEIFASEAEILADFEFANLENDFSDLAPATETNTNESIADDLVVSSAGDEQEIYVFEGVDDVGDFDSSIETNADESIADDSVEPSAEDEQGIYVFDGLADKLPSPVLDLEAIVDPSSTSVPETASTAEEVAEEFPSLESIFGSAAASAETDAPDSSSIIPALPQALQLPEVNLPEVANTPETIDIFAQSITEVFENLPPVTDVPTSALTDESEPPDSRADQKSKQSSEQPQQQISINPSLSVRVNLERLERMNNLVGELAINRSSLYLQNEQIQRTIRELFNRFTQLRKMMGKLQDLSDQMLVPDSGYSEGKVPPSVVENLTINNVDNLDISSFHQANFDSLEMDRYNSVHSLLQGFLENMVQLEESVNDISLFAKQSDQVLEQQQHMLTGLRDELIWSRMLPLGEVLKHFPRTLRTLSNNYNKPVNLKIIGTGVLVDKAVLEKINTPLLHLLQNAFAHGIESSVVRQQKGKAEVGQIEIKAYHQGGQTIIEISDDGQGLNLEKIGKRALDLKLLSFEQLGTVNETQLSNLIFQPGFSTAEQVSEIAGRGAGLDVVYSQVRSLKGTITVSSKQGVGTTFTLRLPLTLTLAKLFVGLVNSTAVALPSDSIEEIVVPQADDLRTVGGHRFLHWRGEIVPTYRMADLLDYAYPMPVRPPSKLLVALPAPVNWGLPLLVIRQGQQVFALEIERLVTEQELAIKPFGQVIPAPSYTYGCTILADGTLVPVIDGAALLAHILGANQAATNSYSQSSPEPALELDTINLTEKDSLLNSSQTVLKPLVGQGLIPPSSTSKTNQITSSTPITVLVVDDAVTLRRTLAFSLERKGYRVLQAGDGAEALKQLQNNSFVKLVICDIEMPNMNGFEFLKYRRQNSQLSAIPVVMLTSRSNDKHQWLAKHLGANAYFTKPYIEQEFLLEIQNIINHSSIDSISPI
ncbi:MAG: response regulator [Symploca sp. SIO1C4]|uniref:histidine kinase n=1 Tax=Symploca sp. SIO1C4 TaxID=2607765 RepID=A0A6B3N8B9_9CYAN|nr:response regulator [Symploca sp. SIO1C4]